MTDSAPAETFTVSLELSEGVLRDIEAFCRLLGVDADTLLRHAVPLYRHLEQARRTGDRIWAGPALAFAEEWRWP